MIGEVRALTIATRSAEMSTATTSLCCASKTAFDRPT